MLRFDYALDPPTGGDTAWSATRAHELSLVLPAADPPDPLPPGKLVRSGEVRTFVLRAIDDQSMASPVAFRSFTSRTVAPEAYITASASTGRPTSCSSARARASRSSPTRWCRRREPPGRASR